MIGIIIFTITGLLLAIPLVILDNKLKQTDKKNLKANRQQAK